MESTDEEALADAVVALTTYLEPHDAVAILTQASHDILTRPIKEEVYPSVWDQHRVGKGLSAVASRLQPHEAAGVVDTLLQDSMAAGDWDGSLLVLTLPALADRLEPSEAARLAAPLSRAVKGTLEHLSQMRAEALAALARHMEPKKAVEALTAVIKEETDRSILAPLSKSLSEVAGRLSPAEAPDAAAVLIRAMRETHRGEGLSALESGLSAVAARMDAEDAAKVAAVITLAVKEPNEHIWTLASLTKGMSATAQRVKPADRAAVVAPAISALARAAKEIENGLDLAVLAGAILDLGEYVEGEEINSDISGVIASLTRAMKATKNRSNLHSLVSALTGVRGRRLREGYFEAEDAALDAVTADLSETNDENLSITLVATLEWFFSFAPEKHAEALLRAAKGTKNPIPLRFLAQRLSDVTRQLEPQKAAAVLTEAVKETKDTKALQALGEGLSAAAGRLDPGEAAEAARLAATVLTGVMKESKDPDTLRSLAESLSWTVARLDPAEAALTVAPAVTLLSRAMTEARSARDFQSLSQGLSALQSPPTPATQRTRSAVVASAVSSVGGTRYAWNALAPVVAAAAPLPSELPTQELVELLKHPQCVGEARRAVLDHLGTRYGRHFADQWEFVRFAEEQNLGLAFTTPPRRPTTADR
jgi:hypothetical protein